MKVYIRDIPEGGTLALGHVFEKDAFSIDEPKVGLEGPMRLEGLAQKGVNVVSIDLKLDGELYFECSRCLKLFTRPFNSRIKFSLEVSQEDNVIELDQRIREEIILNIPLRSLCKEECRGLCPECGKDLNEEECNCKK